MSRIAEAHRSPRADACVELGGASDTKARDRLLLSGVLAGLAVLYVAGLGLRPLVAPDEFRYAEIPREMLASGDWIVPRLNGVPYFEKPVLGYWVTAVSLLIFGENAAAARLPSALATLLTAAIVFALVRRHGPGNDRAIAAALCFLTSVEVAAIGTAALLDALFALGVSASLAAFFVATQRAPGGARQMWLAASGFACGAAFLTKGFLAFAIPAVAAVPYLVWSQRSRDLLRLPWTPLATALVTVVPWAGAVAAADPDFWRHFVVNEHLRRFAGGANAQHAEPFWFYVPVLLIGALPWLPLLAPALRRCGALADVPLVRFSICWLVAPLLLLSASSGKLATYPLPCFAPLFILFACSAATLAPTRLAAIGAAMGLGCALAAWVFPTAIPSKTPERFLETRVGPISRDAIVVADRYLVHAVCWQLRRDDVLVVSNPGELRYGLERPDQRARLLDETSLAALIRDPARERPVVVLTRPDRTLLPADLAPTRRVIWRNASFAQYEPLARAADARER